MARTSRPRPAEEEVMYTIRKVLHPTDFSGEAAAAFRVACSLALRHEAELVVLHVIPPPLTWGEAVARMPPDGYEEQLWREYLTPMQPTEPGVRLERRLEEGDPAKKIVAVADELGCDLIVVGTHGRGGLGRLLMGSVADKVLRKAPCPVLTVRSAYPADAPAGAAAAPVQGTAAEVTAGLAP
jgi:nucleotide-binding universal stress UspA family protein